MTAMRSSDRWVPTSQMLPEVPGAAWRFKFRMALRSARKRRDAYSCQPELSARRAYTRVAGTTSMNLFR